MAKILLDYVFPISVVTPIQAASTAFLRQVCLVARPKSGQSGNVGNVYACTTMAQVAARTDNVEAQQLFNAGMSKVYILLMDELDLEEALETNRSLFHTVLISSDFDDADIELTAATLVKAGLTFNAKVPGVPGNDISIEFVTGGTAGSEVVTVVGKKISVSMNVASTGTQLKTALEASAPAMLLLANPVVLASGQGGVAQAAFAEAHLAGGDGLNKGAFAGVLGYSTDDEAVAAAFAAVDNQAGFFASAANGAKNMAFAFGALLSNLTGWLNQQFIAMPFSDDVEALGDANSMFDDNVSFVIEDEEFGNRLGLFAAGGRAIAAPYILKNLRIDLQSRALTWISANQPQYTIKEASLLEARLQEDVINAYVRRGLIDSGVVLITLEQDNFVATGRIEVPQPKALWRVFSEMTETV